nr:MAG TPA: exodeoxyribonuclease V [Myoviridae sp. ctNPX13]
MQLNRGQETALQNLLQWWRHRTKQVFEISGAAGTGKTTIVRELIDSLGLSNDQVLFMAYIGKATLALSRTGLNAKTIHSSICDIEMVPKEDENGDPIVTANKRYIWVPKFSRKKYLDGDVRLIVVDEAAMVPEELAKWILEFNIPVIALGDLNQLPPVIGNSFFLKRPDVVLTEIMRQSSESPIPWLAKSILEGRRLERGIIESKIAIMGQRDFDKRLFKESDIIICGTNKTRENLNNYYRNELLKIDSADPIVGDKMICRQNNWDAMIGDNIFLINGLVGYITNIDLEFSTAKRLTIDFRPEFLSESFYDLALDREYLRLPFQYRKSYISRMNKFEYGYAITCHLAQGSQYNKVIVVNEPFGDSLFRKQWLYTAVTRAIDQLIILN